MSIASRSPPSSAGVVYILSNPAWPHLKIGGSGRSGEDRRRELSRATSVPHAFVLEWECPVSDWRAIEALVHTGLNACRPNHNREFFSCTVAEAKRAIEKEAKAYLRPWWWKLFTRPARVSGYPTSRYPRRRRNPANPLPLLVFCLGLVVSILYLHPRPPIWLPGPIGHTINLIERLNHW